MKKITSIFVFLLFAFSLSAMQQTTLEHSNLEQRVQKLEEQSQIDMQTYDYLSSYAANCYISVDALIWAADNYGWASFVEPEDDGIVNDFHHRKLDFDPGLRLGFGVKTCYDWDLFLQWTHFHSSISDHETDDITGLASPFFPYVCYDFKTKFKIKYDMLDLEIGRPFNAAKTFVLKTHIGLRTGWIKQRGINRAENVVAPEDGETTPGENQYRNKMWVIGPRIGLNADYYFGTTGLSFYGMLTGALLYANPDISITSYTTNETTGAWELNYYATSKNKELKSTIQAAFGLAWGDFITEDKDVALTLRVGWEGNYWWNMYDTLLVWQQPVPEFYDVNEPLVMQGVTINARIDF